ncbi:MAG: homocysteine S-methyltransferase family protein [Oscillospiraceae bacterium]|jgi:S-methylmethionine-dependent homocysteine/selenocysteine methylase
MNLSTCIRTQPLVLLDGALSERLKRDFHIPFDPHVAMAGSIYDIRGVRALDTLWRTHIAIAKESDFPLLLLPPTRRANRERIAASRYSETIFSDYIRFMNTIRKTSGASSVFLGGLMGCRGDAYKADDVLSVAESRAYHSWAADHFASAGADYLYAGIMPAVEEAVGMAQSMGATGLPYIVSFMLRKNGRLIDGTTIHDAIARIDNETDPTPLCYVTNCVHPTVLYEALSQPFNQTELVRRRFLGIQSNTSPLPPEELDGAKELQTSSPEALAADVLRLYQTFRLRLFGGCCGTNFSHLSAIAAVLKESVHK